MFSTLLRTIFILFAIASSQAHAAFVASGIGNVNNVTFIDNYPSISILINTSGNVTYSDTFTNTTTIAFDWKFSAKHDPQAFSSSGSKAGYKIDNTVFTLSPTLGSSGFETDNGSEVVTVSAGSTFAFFSMFSGIGLTEYDVKILSINTQSDGPSRGNVSSVPLPASAPLLLSALASFGLMKRRKQSS